MYLEDHIAAPGTCFVNVLQTIELALMARNTSLSEDAALGSPTLPTSSRGRQRTEKILEAARELFLERGYHATSIDMVVQRSGGSKGTLYSYFPNKAALFRAVVRSIVSREVEPSLDPEKDITKTLMKFADYRMKVVASEENLALVRLILAEQKRFPDLAAMYWEEGPQRGQEALSEYFRYLKERGHLNLHDPRIGADQLVALLMQPWYLRQLYLPWTAPSGRTRRRHARETIRVFLTLYGTASA